MLITRTLQLFKYIQHMMFVSENNNQIKNILLLSQINLLLKNYNNLINLNHTKILNIMYPPLEINSCSDLNNYLDRFQIDSKYFDPVYLVDHVIIENKLMKKYILIKINIVLIDQNINVRSDFKCQKCNKSVLINCNNNDSKIEMDTRFCNGQYKCKNCISISNIKKRIYKLEMKN